MESLANRSTYVCYPSKNVCVEAYMVFRYIEATLNEGFMLQSTAVIYHEEGVRGGLAETTPADSSNPLQVYLKADHESLHSAYYLQQQCL
jgi:hypothetical protein